MVRPTRSLESAYIKGILVIIAFAAVIKLINYCDAHQAIIINAIASGTVFSV